MTFIPETCRVHLIRYLRFINEKMQMFYIWQKCSVEDFEDTKEESESVSRRMTDNTMVKIKKDKRTNNEPQNTTQTIKDRAARTPLKTGGGPG